MDKFLHQCVGLLIQRHKEVKLKNTRVVTSSLTQNSALLLRVLKH